MSNRITELTQLESERQKNTLNLIASENYPSPKVMNLLGSNWSLKYAEGYPGKRYYAGQLFTDELETFVQQKALEVFDTTGEYRVNVQVLSGSPANGMVFLSALEPGDTILSLNLANGGHLSHLHNTSNWNKFFTHATYDVKEVAENTYEIDEEDFIAKLKSVRPKLTIIGFSAYPRVYDIQKLTRIAHEHGSLVLADIAHVNGLVAAGLHSSPFAPAELGADFVSMTTHKTLRGPRSALLFAKKEYIAGINKTIFPGTSGGPHMNKIAAVGQCLLEILGEDVYPDNRTFLDYSQAVIDNSKALEKGLSEGGLTVISPTQNHLCLVRLPEEVDSLSFQKVLGAVGIVTNRNMIPFDTKSAWRPSGMRFGTAALTSRGLSEDMAYTLGNSISAFAHDTTFDIMSVVVELTQSLSWWLE